MFDEQGNGLKGQFNIARGNPGETGSRPGLDDEHINRPCEDVYQRETLVSDEGDGLLFPDKDVLPFRPERFFLLYSPNLRGRLFFCILYPGRRFGSFLPHLAPG